jgi:hypothetical protein
LKKGLVPCALHQDPFSVVFSGFLYPGRDCSLPR